MSDQPTETSPPSTPEIDEDGEYSGDVADDDDVAGDLPAPHAGEVPPDAGDAGEASLPHPVGE